MALSNKKLFWALAGFIAAALLSSCAPYQARRTTPPQSHATGTASWYGPGFHGRKTASGERYNQNELTAAHRTLPFGSSIEVKNISNGKTAVVRINDRGPFIRGRIIDLSKAAAQMIGMLGTGTARVELASLGSEAKEEVTAQPEKAAKTSKQGLQNTKKWKFSPPPPPPTTQDIDPRAPKKVFYPSDTTGDQQLRDQDQDVMDKTGMPPEGDRF